MLLLASITYYVTIYIGIFIYIFGFSGSLLNILILFSNRHNSCIFLLIYSSIVDFFVLNIGLLPRILSVGFNIDPTLSNLIWCKIRTYGLRISSLIPIFTICLMSIDRLFISCRTVRWRQLSNLSFMRWAIVFISFIIVVEGLPFLILTQILRTNNTVSCTPMYNPIFAKYASFFSIPFMYGIIPLSVMMTMGILIYYNLHNRTHLRKVQRSLTVVILLRIIFVLISCGPYGSYFVYSAIVSITIPIKSPERINIENFILSIVSVFLYITYSSSFFVYYFTSSKYRKQLIDLFIHFRRERRNRVQPAHVIGMTRLAQTNRQMVINNNNEENETT